jgi:hypothetical protein
MVVFFIGLLLHAAIVVQEGARETVGEEGILVSGNHPTFLGGGLPVEFVSGVQGTPGEIP